MDEVFTGETPQTVQTPYEYSHNSTIYQLNDARAKILMPVVVFMSFVIFTGISGNIIVILIYVKRFKRTATTIMIVTAAILDTLSCFLILPFEIADTIYPYINGYVMIVPCKLFRFLGWTLTSASFFILVSLGYIRYCKVVRPLTVITTKRGITFVWVCIVFAAFISVPMTILFGYHTEVIAFQGHHLNGSDCSIDDAFDNTVWVPLYGGFFLFIYVSFTTSMVFFYTNIIRQIWRLRERTSLASNTQGYNVRNSSQSISTVSGTNVTSCEEMRVVSGKTVKSTKAHVMFAVISSTMILWFAPIFIIDVIKVPLLLETRRKSDPNLDLLLEFFQKMFALSFCTNPLVYTIMDRRFRQEFSKFVKLKFPDDVDRKANAMISRQRL